MVVELVVTLVFPTTASVSQDTHNMHVGHQLDVNFYPNFVLNNFVINNLIIIVVIVVAFENYVCSSRVGDRCACRPD